MLCVLVCVRERVLLLCVFLLRKKWKLEEKFEIWLNLVDIFAFNRVPTHKSALSLSLSLSLSVSFASVCLLGEIVRGIGGEV